MRSIFLRNFFATALLVFVSFLIIALSFVGIGRTFVISDYRSKMENSAKEVARTASAIAQGDSLSSWVLSMSISSVSHSTGDHIFITDADGVIVSCSDKNPMCEHLGVTVPEAVISSIGETPFDALTDLGGLYHSRRYVAAVPIPAAALTIAVRLSVRLSAIQFGRNRRIWSLMLTSRCSSPRPSPT